MTPAEIATLDRRWFAEHPAKEYRVREASTDEHAPIKGLRIFTVVYADEVDRPDLREFIRVPTLYPVDRKREVVADTVQQILRLRVR